MKNRITPERWESLQKQFQQLLDCGRAEQSALLADIAARDPVIADDLRTLLAAHDEAADFLDSPPVIAWQDGDDIKDAWLGQRLDVYELVRKLGEGGTGSVYLARRTDEAFEQQVAVKLVRREAGGGGLLRRFRMERQILAGLQHPGIAHLYAGGASDDGVPYFVMEYVDGEPIDAYCNRHRLTLTQRIELFIAVCEILQFAHQHLVVHRDIKPGNILITADGAPKLLDFGIAKLLEPAEFPGTVEQTVTGLRLMTPHYASPEQVTGRPISTASDIYSMGVLLYRLLTGCYPYDFATSAHQHIEQVICTMPPKRPRDVLTNLPADGNAQATTDTICHKRRTGLHGLRQQLTGDIEQILFKALSKMPSRRYSSIEQLAEDLKRWRTGLPVSARAITFGYRAGKFLRRHRVGMAVTAAVLGMLIAFAVAMTLQAARIATERNQAQLERDKAQQISGFLTGLFELSGPNQLKGQDITARELLDLGAANIDAELLEQPGVRASVLNTLGNIYSGYGAFDKAENLLREALALRLDVLGPAHADSANSMNNLGHVLVLTQRYDEAESLLKQGLKVRQQALGEQHPRVAVSLHNLGWLYHEQGDNDTAQEYYRQALALRRQLLGDQHSETALTMNNLAVLYKDAGDYSQSEQMFREALATQTALLGEEHIEVSTVRQNLAGVLARMGRYAEAEPLYRQALAVDTRLLGEKHPDVITTMNNLAVLLHRMQKYAQAEPLYRKVLEQRRELYGHNHSRVATTMQNLAVLLRDRQEYATAQVLLEDVLRIKRAELGNEHASVANTLHYLGSVLARQNQHDAALDLLQQTQAMRLKLIGDDHPNYATTLVELGRLHLQTADCSAALPLFQQALKIRVGKLPAGHPDIDEVQAYLDTCNPAEAG